MSKKSFIRIFATIVAIMVAVSSFAGALSVFADDPAEDNGYPDWAGTFEDGITYSNNNVHTLGPQYGFLNGDFEQGLYYWGPRSTAVPASASDFVDLIETGGNHYVQLKAGTAQYAGIKSTAIAISDEYISDGDHLVLLFDVKGGNVEVRLDQRYSLSGTSFASGASLRADGSLMTGNYVGKRTNGWNTYFTSTGSAVAPRPEGSAIGQVSSGYYEFYIGVSANVALAESGACVDNIRLAKLDEDGNLVSVDGTDTVLAERHNIGDNNYGYTILSNGEGFYGYTFDFQPIGGTEESGIYTARTSLNLPAATGEANLDFSQGFKFWAVKSDRTGYPSDYIDIVKDGSGNVDYVTYKAGITQYSGIESAKFKPVVPLEAGDKVAVMININSTATAQFYLHQYDADGRSYSSELTSGKDVNKGSQFVARTWTTSITAAQDVITADSTFAVYTQIMVARAQDAAEAVSFKDLRVVKLTADPIGGGYLYTDILTGEVLYSNGNPYGGTAEDGIFTSSTSYYYIGGNANCYKNFPASEKFENGDFSDGFRFWAANDASNWGSITNVATHHVAQDGNYVKFKATGDGYRGIVSSYFRVPGLKSGDMLGIYAEIRNTSGGIQFELDAKSSSNLSTTYCRAQASNSSPTAWSPIYTQYVTSFPSISATADSDTETFYLQLKKVNADENTAEVRNIHIVKYVRDNANDSELLVDAFDGSVVFDFSALRFGTVEDGILSSYQVGHDFIANGHNLDFSQGFRYWGLKSANYASASTKMEIVEEANGNKYAKFRSTAVQYEQLMSTLFAVPEAPTNIQVGDTLTLIYKIKNANIDKAFPILYQTTNVSYGPTDVTYTNTPSVVLGTDSNGWTTAVANPRATVVARADGTTPGLASSGYYGFRIIISEREAGVEAAFDDIRVVKVVDGRYYDVFTGEEFTMDEYYGTEESGFNGKAMYNVPVLSGPHNIDFSEGLKYWTSANDQTYAQAGATAYASLNNGVLSFTGTRYSGVATAPFTVSLNEGEGIAIKYDSISTTANIARIRLLQKNGSTTVSNPAITVPQSADWKTNIYNFGTPNASATSFILSIEYVYSDASKISEVSISNMQIVKYSKDALNDTEGYYDILDGSIVSDLASEKFGTPQGGFSGVPANNVVSSKNNLDFSQGFKYWGTSVASTAPSAIATIKTEANGNKYIQFDSAVAQYNKLQSILFAVPEDKVAVGDALVLLYKCKATEAPQAWLRLAQRTNTGSITELNSNNAPYVMRTDSNGWSTAITWSSTTVQSRAAGTDFGLLSSGYYAFRITIEARNAGVRTAIDDIRVAKVVDGKYYDVFTGDEIVIPAEYYGSEETGFDSNAMFNIPALEEPTNLDFSQGFKYWGGTIADYLWSNTKGGNTTGSNYADAYASLDNGVLKLKGTTRYSGVATARFTLSGMQSGDKIAIKYDSISKSASLARIRVYQMNSTNGKAVGNDITIPTSSDWQTNYSYYNLNANATSFIILVQYISSDASLADQFSLRNLSVYRVYKNSSNQEVYDVDGEQYLWLTHEPYYGTEEKGMYIGGGMASTTYIPTQSFENGDFSKGLKYWMSKRYSYSGYIANDAFVDEQGRLVVNYTENYMGVYSVKFKLGGAKAGDTIKLSADIVTTAGVSISVNQNALGDSGSGTWVSGYAINANSTKTRYLSSGVTLTEGDLNDQVYYIRIQHAGAFDGSQSIVDNLKFLRVNADGTYTDISTGKTIAYTASGQEAAAEIDGTMYETLDDAIESAQVDGTIRLLTESEYDGRTVTLTVSEAVGNIDSASLQSIISEAIATADTEDSEINIRIDIECGAPDVDETGDTPTVTYEVHPVANVYEDDALISSEEIDNSALKDTASFTVTLAVQDALKAACTSGRVKITHVSSSGEYGTEIGSYEIQGTEGNYYVTFTVTHFSSFELAVDDLGAVGSADFGATLSLEDEIIINFYVKNLKDANGESDPSNFKVVYTFRGVETQVALDSAISNQIVVGTCAAKEISDIVNIKVYYGETVIREIDYSAQIYCERQIQKASNSKLVDICKALLDYGTYAQMVFGYNTENPANANYTAGTVGTTVVPSDYAAVKSGDTGIVKVIGASLSLESRTQINVYFTPQDDYSAQDYEVYVDGARVTATSTLDGMLYVKISGIVAKNLGKVYSIEIHYGGEVLTLEYSALTYAYRNQNKASEGGVCKALYNYYLAADAYFAE